MGKLNKYQRKASNLNQATDGKFGKKEIVNQTVDLTEIEGEKPEDLSQEASFHFWWHEITSAI
jgi:hypothetical protein